LPRAAARPSTHAAAIALTRAAGIFVALVALAGAAEAEAALLPVTLDPSVTREAVVAHGTRREAIVTTAPSAIRARVEALPAGARLLTAIAVPSTTAVPASTAGQPATAAPPVRFRILFDVDGASTTLYERVLDGADTRDQRWVDVGISLAAFQGRSGTFSFETTAVRPDSTGPAAAWWAPPLLGSCALEGPSLLLVTIDALRADRLGSAGYARPTTPRLDAFAADATRFTRAFSGGPKTVPSVPQILTGNYFYWQRPGRGLADLLGVGMPSRAIVNNPYVAVFLRNERPGFEAVHAGDLDARAITSAALRYLTAAGRCPSALYLHYLDTHTPYHAPPRWARRFIDRKAATTIGLAFDDVTGAWQDRYQDADKRRIADLYDGSLAYTDRQIGRLLRGLARRGRLDRTLVIVTADHGEELWDHHQFFHGQSLYDELLHVPLLVRFPSVGHGQVVEHLVRTVDIVPTIAEVLGHATAGGDGRSLRPLAAGAAEAEERTAFALVSSAEPRTPERQAVRTTGAKLVRNVADGQLEVYDLASDPKEKRNLGPAAPDAPALLRTLDGFRAQLDGKGYHVRLRGRSDRTVRYALDVTSIGTPVPLIAIDRLTLEPDDLIEFKPRASAFSLTGTLAPGDDDHVRFDVLWGVGTLKLALRVDGAKLPESALRLGARAVPAFATVDVTNPDLDGEPALAPPADAVTLELWRASPPATAAPAPALDDATRERLRQLGYVE